MDEKQFLQADLERIRKIKKDISAKLNAKLTSPSSGKVTVADKLEWVKLFGDSLKEMNKQISSIGKGVDERLSAGGYDQGFANRVRAEYNRVIKKLRDDFVEENK